MVRIKAESLKKKLQSSVESRAMKRLMKDKMELEREPLTGVAAQPIEDNLFVWHANLAGPEGTPWEGGIFHFVLRFPHTYPDDPPTLKICTKISHPNVMGDSVCLDMLERRAEGQSNKYEGWSAAYSVLTILIQLQAFLFESSVTTALANLSDPKLYDIEKQKWLSGVKWAVDQSVQYQDASVKHHPPRNPWPPLPANVQQQQKTVKDLLKEELVCYYTKQTFEQDCLGVGVKFTKNMRTGELKTIQSPVDLLSLRAYMNNNVRLSAMNEKFTHWLPVYINAEHGLKARHLAKRSLSMICTGSTKNFNPDMVLQVLPRIMSTMVVEVMTGKRHSSLKAFRGYCFFHRLFLMFIEEFPQIKQKCNEIVHNFIHNDACRHKDVTPNLGEFLTLLTVTDFHWKDVCDAYLEESFTRNVFWILAKYPDLENIDSGISDEDRLKFSFDQSSRLLHFHVFFLERIARPLGMTQEAVIAQYDEYLGLPTPQMEEMFLTVNTSIMKVSNYQDYLRGVGREFTNEQIAQLLKAAIGKSKQKGYHGSQPAVLSPEQFAKENQAVNLEQLLVTDENGNKVLHSDEAVWKQMCGKRFGITELPSYLRDSNDEDAMDTDSAPSPSTSTLQARSNPWRQLYMQSHLQDLIQRLNDTGDFKTFYRAIELSADIVTRLEIQSFDPNRLNSRFHFLNVLLTKLKKLDTFIVTKGERGLGVKGFKELVKGLSNNPGNLRSLILESCDINAECIDEFTKGKLVSGNLQQLKLAGNPICDNGAIALATFLREHQVLPHLTELDLSHCQISSRGAEALAEALLVKKELKILLIKSNGISTGGNQLLTNLAYSPSITEIDASNASLNRASASLAKLLKLSVTLQKLNLWKNTSMALDASFFKELKTNRSLKQLDLAETSINDSQVRALGDALATNTVLTTLDLEGNSITGTGLSVLYEELSRKDTKDTKYAFSLHTLSLNRNPLSTVSKPKHHNYLGYIMSIAKNLTVLKLDRCDLTRDDMEAVGNALDPTKYASVLRELSLSRNRLDKTGLKPLVNGLMKNTTLEKLDVSGNKLGVPGAKMLAQILEKNRSLKVVSVFGNFVEIEGAISIATAIEKNTTLKELDLGLNRIRVRGAKQIVSFLAGENPTLERLSLKHNHITEKVALDIARVICMNPARVNMKYIALAGNHISDSIRGEIAVQIRRERPGLTFDLAKLAEVKDSERQERSIYISPLSYGVSERMIKNFFFTEKCGHVMSVSIHTHKRALTSHVAQRYAFVEFAHPDSVTLAMRLPHAEKNIIGGNKVMFARAGVERKQEHTGRVAKKIRAAASGSRGGRVPRGRGRGRGRGGRR